MVDRFAYQRRPTRTVRIGDLVIGGDRPIMVQSMCTTPTQDVAATVAQAIRLAEAGCELVRITAPGVKDAQALKPIREQFSAAGFGHIPLCADIHFMPAAAMEAIEHVEKVRVNPGNYADKKRFEQRDYTDAEWAEERERVRERFAPLVVRAKELGRALRIGTNHGSLSDRIMNRYGDSPEGMCASAIEFIEICEDLNFHDIVISMKASNPKVMVQAYRMLVDQLDATGRAYPLHLGVTEAGNAEDGRCKSAAGIGCLLDDGIGDTIRVSLTEEPEAEIPVARELCQIVASRPLPPALACPPSEGLDPLHFSRRPAEILRLPATGKPEGLAIGGGQLPRVLAPDAHDGLQPAADVLVAWQQTAPADDDQLQVHRINEQTTATTPDSGLLLIDLPAGQPDAFLRQVLATPRPAALLGIGDPGPLGSLRAYRLLAALIEERFQANEAAASGSGCREAICLALCQERDLLNIASIAGSLLIDGIGDAIFLPASDDPRGTAFLVLQSVRARMTKADFVACPSCGRTLFDLQEVTAAIKAATGHLDGVAIAIMGCIVNGPGEMADADFGYVGSGPGKITLYRGKEAVHRNIPAAEARDRLIQLIKDSGRWKDPAAADHRSQ